MVSMRSLFAYFWKDQPRVIYFVLCCLVILALAYCKRYPIATRLRNRIVLPALLVLVVFGNPVSAHILVTKTLETQSLRFFWLIPVSLFLAATTVVLLDFVPNRGIKVVMAVAVIPVLFLSGNGLQILQKNWKNDAPNWYKIPPVVIDLCDYIVSDDNCSEKSAAFCFPLNLWVRQYESQIFLPFCWTAGEDLDLLHAMEPGEGQTINLTLVSYLSSDKRYSYIVLPREGQYVGSLETYGYYEVYSVDTNPDSDESPYDKEYVLYRLEEEKQVR